MKTTISMILFVVTMTATAQTVVIGNQEWMKTNSVVGGYCYNNDPANCTVMGALYTWQQAMAGDTTEGAQGICPDGWHIPTLDEAQTLFAILGGRDVVGPKMKSAGKWEFARATCTPAANNSSGFSAIPAGTRYSTGTYTGNTITTMWWTSTKVEGTAPGYEAAYYFGVRYGSTDGKMGQLYVNPVRAQGISVRCIKDQVK